MKKQLISRFEADRAIYVDFEKPGLPNAPPSVLGVLYAPDPESHPGAIIFEQWVVDPHLWPIAGSLVPDAPKGSRCVAADLDVIADDLVRLAEDEDRLLVSWSSHDLTLFLENVSESRLAAAIETRHRDGKLTARRWKNKHHSDAVPPKVAFGGANKLSFYMELVGFAVPPGYGQNVAAKGINAALGALLKTGGSTVGLSTATNRAWKATRAHNYYDCAGMWTVTRRAATELDG